MKSFFTDNDKVVIMYTCDIVIAFIMTIYINNKRKI